MKKRWIILPILLFILILLSSVASASLTDNLVGYWNLNSDATDSSIYSNDGAITGATNRAVGGASGGYYEFDGVNDKICMNADDAYNFNTEGNFTFSIWINVTEDGQAINIFGKQYDGVPGWNGFTYQHSGGSIYGYLYDNIGDSIGIGTGEANITVGTWQNVIFTYNGTRNNAGMNFFWNGTAVNDYDYDAGDPLDGEIQNSAKLCIAARNDAAGFWNGSIDEIGIWNRTLTLTEITQLQTEFYPWPGTPNSSIALFFANNTDLSDPNTTFNEDELLYAFINWTDQSDVVINDSVGNCSFAIQGAIYEEELDIDSTLCNSGCDYNSFTHEFNMTEGNISVVDDWLELGICHNSLISRDVDVSISCGAITDTLTIDSLEFDLCTNGYTEVRKHLSICNGSALMNVTLDNTAPTFNHGHNISEFSFEREYTNHSTNATFNYTTYIWQSKRSFEYHDHGTKNIYGNCTHNNTLFNNNLSEAITIVNAQPVISFDSVTTIYGRTTLANNSLIQYANGEWNWSVVITDDDLDIILYSIGNSTHLIYQENSTSPILITTPNQTFIEFGNVYNFTVIANDTFGAVTTATITFNVSDTIIPVCAPFIDTDVVNGSNFTWNVTCTDANFFSLNISCNGSDNYNFFLDGLNTPSYIFNNRTLIYERTVCDIKYCDGHTRNLIDIAVTNLTSDRIRTFNEKVSIESLEYFSSFEMIYLSDRLNFNITYPSVRNTMTYRIRSDDFIHIMSGEWKGWIVTSGLWIDFEDLNVRSANVRRLSPNVVDVTVAFENPSANIGFQSIGELNCVTDEQILEPDTETAFSLGRFECDLTTTGSAIGIIGFTFLMVVIWIFLIYFLKIPILNIIFGFIMVYFAWYIAQCFFLANVIFIVLGLYSILDGIIQAVTGK